LFIWVSIKGKVVSSPGIPGFTSHIDSFSFSPIVWGA